MATSTEESGETLASKPSPGQAAPLSFATGDARYQRGRELGRGGMGRVVEAVDLQFDRLVAIKELTAEGDRRFALEAQITGRLEHPGIASVHERGLDAQGRPWYAMRKVKGQTVAELLAQAKTMAERFRLLPVVVRTAQTLSYAHENGVIHRDVKPANIMVGAHGDVVLLDWGIARLKGVAVERVSGEGAGRAADATAIGSVVGTPAYMSPEQAEGHSADIDERTDVFALGALLYHVLTGQLPYAGTSVEQMVLDARAARPRPVLEVEPQVPRALAEICAKAMARLPGDRFRNANELAAALEEFESNAVLKAPPLLANAAISTILTLATLLAFSVVATSLVLTKLFRLESANALLLLSGVGLLLSVAEWVTRGRHALGPLSLALALSTFCGGVFFASFHLEMSLPEGAAPLDVPTVTAMVREGVGALSVGAALCSAQLMLWAVSRRRSLVTPEGVLRVAPH